MATQRQMASTPGLVAADWFRGPRRCCISTLADALPCVRARMHDSTAQHGDAARRIACTTPHRLGAPAGLYMSAHEKDLSDAKCVHAE